MWALGGNDACDLVAKRAFKHEGVTPIPLGQSEIVSLVKVPIEKLWQSQWDSNIKGWFSYRVNPVVVPPVRLSRFSCKDQVALIRLRLGHCWFNSYLHRI